MTDSRTTATLPRHVKAGAAAEDGYALVVAPEQAGWAYSGLRVLELAPGGSAGFDTGEDEVIVLPLAGACQVSCDGERFDLVGREGVFAGLTDFAYAPRDARVELSSAGGVRLALPSARATQRLPARYGPALLINSSSYPRAWCFALLGTVVSLSPECLSTNVGASF